MSTTSTPTAYDAALTALRAGLAPWPPKEDGTKAPLTELIPADCPHPSCVALREKAEKESRDARGWIHRQHAVVTEAELAALYSNGRAGVGLVCGTISGGLECLEFEGPAVEDRLVEQFAGALTRAGLTELVDRLADGYIESSPSGGIHILYRCDKVDGNLKLARRAKLPAERAHENDHVQVLIETRGEGGFIIVAPSGGKTHPSGLSWGSEFALDSVPTISIEEREALLEAARSFDQLVPAATARSYDAPPRPSTNGDLRPGDDFNARTSWAEILEPHGWTFCHEMGEEQFWARPGKSCRDGHSASTGYQGSGALYVFSTSTAFEAERSYDKFGAWAALEHGGDHRAAAIALASRGYGIGTWPSPVVVRAAEPVVDDDEAKVSPAVWHGLAGEVAQTLGEYCEADPLGLLVSWLVSFGCLVGSKPHYEISRTRHPACLFAVLLGDTADSRKGTNESMVSAVINQAGLPPDCNFSGGLGSGQGLIELVRDPVYSPKGNIVDEGVVDKRLRVVEGEFTKVLRVGHQQGSTLLTTLRDAWDGKDLRNAVRNNPSRATHPHICMIGHAVGSELAGRLDDDDILGGTANRILFCNVAQPDDDHIFPEGGEIPDEIINDLARRTRRAAEAGEHLGRIERNEEAKALWDPYYRRLRKEKVPGLAGHLIVRGPAQITRLALAYCLADEASVITPTHMRAAIGLWEHARRSALGLLANADTPAEGTDRDVKELLLVLEIHRGEATTTQLRSRLRWNGTKLSVTIGKAKRLHLVGVDERRNPSGGRPITVVRLVAQ